MQVAAYTLYAGARWVKHLPRDSCGTPNAPPNSTIALSVA